MKTKEANIPWDPKPEDQKVDGKLFKDGFDQLERDVLRFLELTPDIPMSKTRITTNLAFPLASERSERVLTKEDLLSENASLLLEKLGVSKEYLENSKGPMIDLTFADEKTFERIICRYLGAHSKVKGKVSMDQGLKALDLAIRGTEGSFQAQATNPNLLEADHHEDIKKIVACDARMKEIKSAVLIPKFGKTFQAANLNIPVNDLKVDKEQFLKQTSSGKTPLFGFSVIKALLRAADERTAHQGPQDIIDFLNKEKFAFHDKNGVVLDQTAMVVDHVNECVDCLEVMKIRGKLTSLTGSGRLLQIPKAMETEVLHFADKRHQGYAVAYKRLKTWANFPDFKIKVF